MRISPCIDYNLPLPSQFCCPLKISGLARIECTAGAPGCKSLVRRHFRLDAGLVSTRTSTQLANAHSIPTSTFAYIHHTNSAAAESAAMASAPVKQDKLGQSQPNAMPAAHKHNLETLQSMMNLVLISSGRFIKEHQSGGGTGRHRANLRAAVPVATERFQDALDELENEVRLAQTVLRRDLALLKQDRKKREIAAKEKEAEKARQVVVSRTMGTAVKPEDVRVEKVSTPTEALPAAEPAQQNEPRKPSERPDEEIPPPPIETSNPPPTERDPLFGGTPTTANPQENDFDFDAMFGDEMDTAGDNNDTHGDMMDTSGDMGFDFGDGGGDGDGQSLLRGLEDFAKSSDEDNGAQNMDMDITMGGLPDINPTIEAPAPAPAPIPPKPAEVPAIQPPAASTNNDTATTKDVANTVTANDAMMADMPTDNLDDLFNMDEYENPENSSFDDAFFNFE
jgi:hypothetical protein